MKGKIQSSQGMTLVELLAAIALLGIVLVTFMTFFVQSAKFTAHNQETLTAVQVAEEIVAELRDIENIGSLNGKKGFTLINNLIEDKTTYEEFDITVSQEIVEVPVQEGSEQKILLKKAIITVKSKPGHGIDNPEFKTEMYLKVAL